MTERAAHLTDGDPQHPAWPQTLISPDLVAELDVLDGDVVLETQPGQGLALGHHVVQELGPVAAGAGAGAVTLPRVSICEQEPFTRSPEAETTISTNPGVTRCPPVLGRIIRTFRLLIQKFWGILGNSKYLFTFQTI